MSQNRTAKSKKSTKVSDSYHHGDLRSTLLQTALQMLKTRHPSEISLRELAREAGVSGAAPYRHFKSKEELLVALAQQGFEIKAHYMLEAWEKHHHNPYDLYIQCGLSYFKMGEEHPQHFKLMFGAQTDSKEYPDFLKAACKTFALLTKMVRECQAQGLMGAGDPFHKAMNCWSVVHGFTNLYAEGRLEWLGVDPANAEQALKELLDQHLAGTRAPITHPKFTPFSAPNTTVYREFMTQILATPTEDAKSVTK